MAMGYEPYRTKRNYSPSMQANFGKEAKEERPDTVSDGTRHPQDLIRVTRSEYDNHSYHPTQKPVNLARYLVRAYSNKGDTVLDHCMGSGSIPLGAYLEHRNYIGIEQDANYYAIACKRMEEAKTTPPKYLEGIYPVEITYDYPLLVRKRHI